MQDCMNYITSTSSGNHAQNQGVKHIAISFRHFSITTDAKSKSSCVFKYGNQEEEKPLRKAAEPFSVRLTRGFQCQAATSHEHSVGMVLSHSEDGPSTAWAHRIAPTPGRGRHTGKHRYTP